MRRQMKNTVIHQHINYAEKKSDRNRHVFFSEEQQCGKKQKKDNVQPDIHRIELPLRDNFHKNFTSFGKYIYPYFTI